MELAKITLAQGRETNRFMLSVPRLFLGCQLRFSVMRMEKKRSGLTLCLLFIFCGRGLESANLESGYQFPSIPIKVSTGKISTVSTFNSISVYFNSPNGKNSEEEIGRAHV